MMTTREDLMRQKCSLVMEADFVDSVKIAQLLVEDPFLGVVVTNDDQVYAVGAAEKDLFGLGPVEEIPKLTKVEQLCGQNIRTFAISCDCDYTHILALSAGGVVYAWGENSQGQLGDGSTTDSPVPVVVAGDLTDEKVRQIGCGLIFSVALTDDGKLFTWGWNKEGRTGQGTLEGDTTSPKVVKGLSDRKIMSCSTRAGGVICLTDRGKLFTFGFNSSGQLGIDTTAHSPDAVQVKVKAKYWIAKVACGQEHSLAMTNDGILLGWGQNTFGQLGVGDTSFRKVPTKINLIPENDFDRCVMDIWAVEDTSFAVDIHGDAYVWGKLSGAVKCDFFLKRPTKTPHKLSFATNISLKPESTGLVAHSLLRSFDKEDTSDLTVAVHGRDMHVHRAILQCRSQYFKNMFNNNWKEKQERKIVIEQYSYEVYRGFLRYLYSGTISHELKVEQLVQLMGLAGFVLDDQLEKLCMERLKLSLSFENVLGVFSLSLDLSLDGLKEYCVKLAMRGMKSVLESGSLTNLPGEHIANFFSMCHDHGTIIIEGKD